LPISGIFVEITEMSNPNRSSRRPQVLNEAIRAHIPARHRTQPGQTAVGGVRRPHMVAAYTHPSALLAKILPSLGKGHWQFSAAADDDGPLDGILQHDPADPKVAPCNE